MTDSSDDMLGCCIRGFSATSDNVAGIHRRIWCSCPLSILTSMELVVLAVEGTRAWATFLLLLAVVCDTLLLLLPPDATREMHGCSHSSATCFAGPVASCTDGPLLMFHRPLIWEATDEATGVVSLLYDSSAILT